MKLNSPLPQSLPKECAKAAKIFQSFVDSGNNGLDGVIPRSILEQAKGFAIFTIFKAGFLFSARAGSGIVIAKLPDGTWSAPSAIGTAGLGIGGQAGAEMTDFLIILNSRSAVSSFMAAGSLTLGGNMSLALGPLGRNGEAVGSLNTRGKVAAMYSYSKTKGLFGGVSIEGSVIVERQDANSQAYQSDVTAKLLLGGSIDPPEWSLPLIKTIEACTGMPGGRPWVQDGFPDRQHGRGYAFGGLSSPSSENSPSFLRKKAKSAKDAKQEFPPESWGTKRDSGSYFTSEIEDEPRPTQSDPTRETKKWPYSTTTINFPTPFESDFVPEEQVRRHPRLSVSMSSKGSGDYFNSPLASRNDGTSSPFANPQDPASRSRPFSTSAAPSYSSHKFNSKSLSSNPFASMDNEPDPEPFGHSRSFSVPKYIAPKPELAKPLLPHEGVARAIALYDFTAVEPGDLSFSKGDVIVITQKSQSTDDWWKGKRDGREGIFPANFVEVV